MPLVDNEGVHLGYSTIARSQGKTREETYKDLYVTVDKTNVYCLCPHCTCKSRSVKLSPDGGFGNFFKHLARYHIGETTNQDYPAALHLLAGKSKSAEEPAGAAAGGNAIAAAFAAGTPEAVAARAAAAAAAARLKLKELKTRVNSALATMILHVNQPFRIVEKPAVRAAFGTLLGMRVSAVPMPSRRTIVRIVDVELDAEEVAEHARVVKIMDATSLCNFGFTHDGATSASGASIDAITAHVVFEGRLREFSVHCGPTDGAGHG